MNRVRVRAIRAATGQIQGWAVEERRPWGWRERDFYNANFYRTSAHQRAMTAAHKIARLTLGRDQETRAASTRQHTTRRTL